MKERAIGYGPEVPATPRADHDVSPELRRFSRQGLDRPGILLFVKSAAQRLEPGTRVLDAAAGTAPYRELFRHCEYLTSDWKLSPHPAARQADIVAPLTDLPVEDGSFDFVLCTQVLEHVSDPAGVLRELRRVLAPGGRICLTAPLVWQLHEEPYDFFRYTPHGLRHLLRGAGFSEVRVQPVTGYFSTLGYMVRICGPITGMTDAPHPSIRRLAGALCWRLGPAVAKLDRFDRRRAFPLVYGCEGRCA